MLNRTARENLDSKNLSALEWAIIGYVMCYGLADLDDLIRVFPDLPAALLAYRVGCLVNMSILETEEVEYFGSAHGGIRIGYRVGGML